MKGYSVGLQMEIPRYVDKLLEQIFKSIFGFTKDYPGSAKQKDKWLRFMSLERFLKKLAYGDDKYLKKDKDYQEQRAALEKLFVGSIFDTDRFKNAG